MKYDCYERGEYKGTVDDKAKAFQFVVEHPMYRSFKEVSDSKVGKDKNPNV